MNRTIGWLVLGGVVLAGCATAPENIEPAYVSEAIYQDRSCEQLGQEQNRLASELSYAADEQRRAARDDAAGVFFLGLPVASMSGRDATPEIARLKGELQAIQTVATSNACTIEILNIDEVIAKDKEEDGDADNGSELDVTS